MPKKNIDAIVLPTSKKLEAMVKTLSSKEAKNIVLIDSHGTVHYVKSHEEFERLRKQFGVRSISYLDK